jgi:hypothetical protein
MNAANNTPRRSSSEPTEVELLLPWYAAGTLNRREAAQVEAALAADPALAERLEWVRTEFAQEIYINEEAASPPDHDVKALFAKIDALPARRAGTIGAPTFAERIAEFFAALSPRTLAWSGAAAALVILLQAGVIADIAFKERSSGESGTASMPANTPADGSYVLMRFQPQATAADIASFLTANEFSIVEGPSRGSMLYRVRVAETKLAKPELTAIVNKLQNDKVIGFIATTE